jgi:hypothetical protein
MADDPIQIVTFMGNDVREVISEIHVDQESHHDQGKGVVHDAAGDFQQQKNCHDAEEEIQRFRKGGPANELIRIDEGIGDCRHAQESQEQVHPKRPATRISPDRIDDKGQAEDEGHVDHAEGVGFNGPYRAIDRPADKTDIETSDCHGGFPSKLPHQRLRNRFF